jgi:outer membrane protein assembly factor BamB
MSVSINRKWAGKRLIFPILYAYIAALSLFVAPAGHAAARWPQFRGPNGSGVAEQDKPPVEFGPSTNFLWTTSLPPGHSSPCIWDDHIFLTGLENGKLETMSLRRTTGRLLWRATAPAQKIEKVHEFSSPASSTPTSDGQRVYSYFGSYGLLAYDFDGKEVWKSPLPKPVNGYGTATSPILIGEHLLLLCDGSDGNSHLLALDRVTGQTAWKKDRPLFTANWSTPIVWRHDAQDDIVVAGSGRLIAYDPKDGAERWWVNEFPRIPICLPVLGGSVLFVCVAGQGLSADDKFDLPDWPTVTAKYDTNKDAKLAPGELPAEFALHLRKEVSKETPGNYFPMSTVIRWFDADKDGLCSENEWQAALAFVTENKSTLMAIRPGGKGDCTSTHVMWKSQRSLPEMPSPIYHEGRLFTVRDGGLVSCLDPKTGQVLYQERLGAPGQYCASLVAADGKLYASSVAGTVVVFKAGAATIEVLARNALNERIVATPAIADDKLFVRTVNHFYAFGK